MATLDSIEVLVQANIEQFQKQMSIVQNQMTELGNVSKQTGKAVSGSFTGGVFKANIFSQILLKTIGKLGNMMFNVGKQVMMAGTQLTRMRVATNTLARNVGISVGEINDLRKSLAEANTYGIKAERVISSLTRSGLWEMSKGMEVVDARTGELTKGLNALVLVMKDLGASAGLSSSEAIAKVTEFIDSGVTSSVKGMIAIGDLGAEYKMYGRTLNKSREDMTAVELAQARMNLVMREGKKAWGSYSDAYTTAGKMLGSIKDAMSSIFEELGSALEPMWASITGGVLEFVASVRNFLIDNTETIRAWATKIAGTLQWLVQSIGKLLMQLPKIGGYFEKVANFQVKSAKAGGKQAKSLSGVTEEMDDATGSAKELKKAQQDLASFDEMNVLKEQEAGGGGNVGGTMLPDPQETEGLLAGIDEAIGRFSQSVKDKMQPVIDKLKEMFAPMVELWNKWVKPAWDGLIAQVKMLGNTIKNSPIMPILEVLAEVLGVIIVGAIGIVINAFTGLIAYVEFLVIRWSIGFEAMVDWLSEVILKVRDWFSKWGDAVDGIKQYFKGLIQFFTGIFTGNFSKAWAGITNILGGAFKFWKNIFGNIKRIAIDVFSEIKSRISLYIEGFKNIFKGMVKFVSGVFKGDWKKAWQGVIQVFAGIFQQLVAIFKTPMNVIISGINTFIRGINRIKIPDWVGGAIGGKGFHIPQMQKLEQGGVVESQTIAMIGEAGREVVMPLDRNTGWIEELAGKINAGGGNMNLTVKIGEDKIYDKLIDYINDKSYRTQNNFLRI